jgi:hypothetical protein
MPVVYTSDVKKLPKREKNDFYPTPKGTVESVVRHFRLNHVFPLYKVIDLGAGTGVWGECIRHFFPLTEITGVEIDRRHERNAAYNLWLNRDALSLNPKAMDHYSISIGNPPFKYGQEFVELGLAVADYVLYLLPTHFTGSIKRMSKLFAENPPMEIWQLTPRINFTGNGNPNEYFMFLWKRGYKGHPIFRWVEHTNQKEFSWET